MTDFVVSIFTPNTLAALFVSVILLLLLNIFLFWRLNRVFRGSNARNLEHLIDECIAKIKILSKHDDMLAKHALNVEERLSSAVRNVSTLRFKAFESGVSNQSFAIAMIDEKGNGVVISSLHNRDRVATYAKPVKEYRSEFDLTDEELAVLEEAHKENTKDIETEA